MKNKLSSAEEQLMDYVWKKEPVFLKDLIESYSTPKPASTTIVTLLKRMQDKGFISYELFGNSRRYFTLVKKEEYFSRHVKGMIKDFFGNSAIQFASFFTKTGGMTKAELEDLKKIIDQQIKKSKK
jgi:BlaI family transcriptional regulator, penicillinase repressor